MTQRSLSAALLDRAVGAAGRLNRRSALRRSAMAATALAVVPADFALRPTSAYAAVCRCQGQRCACGSQCCDAYTEFCCTLTGSNGCPPGTVAGGWWKVDGSGFCGGAPRYYLDCNAQCGGCGCKNRLCDGSCSGTPCGCAHGDCNNRKAGCTKFRYGQCNNHIGCLGPIVCRIVTCTPPWVFDGSCSTASATDNRTAQHNAPCLQKPFGSFDTITDVGGAMRITGWAIDENLRDGVEARFWVDQEPMVSTMANLTRPDIAAAYPYYGGDHGFDTTIPATPGRHVVCVMAMDQGSGASTFLAFTSVNIAGAIGNLDHVATAPGSIDLGGWAVNGADTSITSVIRALVDGLEVWSGPAGGPRPDVAAATGYTANCGFSLALPATPGAHQVCVELILGDGRTSSLGCREVVVP